MCTSEGIMKQKCSSLIVCLLLSEAELLETERFNMRSLNESSFSLYLMIQVETSKDNKN